ncbi:MAG: NUDIX domain-containing protein [Propionibacteriales bacterium]|nr:NUDIX domain-containing protein [Propionibacteriales bacterium]
MDDSSGARRVRCVGALVHDDQGRLLVVLRAHDPGAGRWSIPGGRVEPGESDPVAAAREVWEETRLVVAVGDLVGSVERDGLGGSVYDIYDYAATYVSGDLAAASDAADARWVTAAELARLPCTPGLLDTLRDWRMLS